MEGQVPNPRARGEGEDQEMLFREMESELVFEGSIKVSQMDIKDKGIHAR